LRLPLPPAAAPTTKEEEMTTRGPDGADRTPESYRRGAEEGVAQVLTAEEVLRLLDRLEELEQVERAAETVRKAHNSPTQRAAYVELCGVLDARKVRPNRA
jgi:hypothetical protein